MSILYYNLEFVHRFTCWNFWKKPHTLWCRRQIRFSLIPSTMGPQGPLKTIKHMGRMFPHFVLSIVPTMIIANRTVIETKCRFNSNFHLRRRIRSGVSLSKKTIRTPGYGNGTVNIILIIEYVNRAVTAIRNRFNLSFYLRRGIRSGEFLSEKSIRILGYGNGTANKTKDIF